MKEGEWKVIPTSFIQFIEFALKANSKNIIPDSSKELSDLL